MKHIVVVQVFFVLCFNISAKAQAINDTVELEKVMAVLPVEHNYGTYLKNSDKTVQTAVSFTFLFYKAYFSSQDVDACVFHPSCSVYTMQSVKQHGGLKGLLEGFDRLLRCHGFVNEKDYPVHHKTHKLHDPL